MKPFYFFVLFLFSCFVKAQSGNPCNPGDSNGNAGCPTGSNCSSELLRSAAIFVVKGHDPNEIVGPAGYDSLKWVSIQQTLPYKILFENDPELATAPVQAIRIELPIHQKLNPSSVRIGDFGFRNFNFTVPPNTSVYSNRLDVRDSLGVYVDVTAGLDVAKRQVFWVFQAIDPATGLATTLNPQRGILPVNDTLTHNGEGFVTYTIIPSSLAQTRDTITAQASITFDTEDVIKTNKWVNTVDAKTPVSNINTLPAVVDSVFNISWVGQDDANGSGVKDYILYVSKNNAPFTIYKDKLVSTTEQLAGDPGSTFSFYTRATDNAGNVENNKSAGDRIVTIKVPANSNIACIGANINITITSSGAGASYRWQVNTGAGFTDITDNTIYEGTTTTQLIIKNAPSSYSGYQYRCKITLGSNISYSTIRKLKFTSTWLGKAGESWHNPANWSCGQVPDEFTNVIIPGSTPANPVLNTNGTCSSLMVAKLGAILFRETVKLNLTGK